MAFSLSIAIKGDLRRMMLAEGRAAARAVSSVIRRRTARLKATLRRQVTSSGLGARLANAWRGVVQPRRGASINTSGLVFSAALVKRGGALVDLFTVFDTGAVIRARGGSWLAIPFFGAIRAAGEGNRRTRTKTPDEYPRGTLVFVRSRRRLDRARLVLATDHTVTVFVLVKVVTLRKRLNIDAAFRAAESGLEEAIVAEWNRQAQREGLDVREAA